jgi:hypothetical protein
MFDMHVKLHVEKGVKLTYMSRYVKDLNASFFTLGFSWIGSM